MKLLRREGNKYRYRERIINLFPKHTSYIEGFFGTDSIFFAKPLARYNILNDNSKFTLILKRIIMCNLKCLVMTLISLTNNLLEKE
ncbi:DNA adenine methylase (plasmid) [Borrelia miyamotoi]|uniref:DNA adenine methylase n=2 Tax=Borrelia miyamotoi TaxID=47466 RepID=A0A481YG02_9SPIR|nr:DNA adenine methylase [Borrelia miyamotoi]AHH05540.1 DNA adenine methylase [Borrelia miyamotoi FR64b]ATQ15491.1 DNA adenine methylase [Borrelia miyamotoi]ATQ18999.1 DNA adenine methylase [Borrelia miyamotoi]QBK62750.1 hypothetical protein EZU67_06350 [Borrelia miyamotoi]QBK64015.1 hypothetical protein EZU68_06475 [Borrelia miyamotoi]